MHSVANNRGLVTAAGSSVGIFVVDLLTPPDLAICVLYLTVVLMVPVRLTEMSVLTGVGVVFTILGGFAGTALGDPGVAWLNRALVVVALIGCAAMVGLWARRSTTGASADLGMSRPPPAHDVSRGVPASAVALPAASVVATPAIVADLALGLGAVRVATLNLRLLNALADHGPRTAGALADMLLQSALPGVNHTNVGALVEQALGRLEEGGLIEPMPDGRWALARTGVAKSSPIA